ncbi:hypothetical protein [Fimbriiglobus ruber]|uniref:Carboxypeptidase regulatory-like domain-containing protein n=1 Tax=Fimbriiglobus ruber TaxID=1908690 RepID=A0A225DRE6_9BACT|nr:hypothetical protein [Fimbriiglobus ruber]OWK39719.1 hypothetical protein FRUB_05609 [Fimbriiglobus ruber]
MTALRWVLLVAAAACGGCGRAPEFAPVEGTVTQGGRPLTKVEVTFYADGDTRGPMTTGWTDDQGRYRVRTESGIEGAVVGRYRVCVHDRSQFPSRPAAAIPAATPEALKKASPGLVKQLAPADGKKPAVSPRIPVAYGRITETPLRAEVVAGGSRVDIQIP